MSKPTYRFYVDERNFLRVEPPLTHSDMLALSPVEVTGISIQRWEVTVEAYQGGEHTIPFPTSHKLCGLCMYHPQCDKCRYGCGMGTPFDNYINNRCLETAQAVLDSLLTLQNEQMQEE